MKMISIKVFSQNLVIGLLLVSSLISAQAIAQSGGGYEINRSTISGGGSRSTGGTYSLVGTIGQPDAGGLSGGDYTLSGGFRAGALWQQCFVNFEHFSRFAAHWLDSPCNEGNNWCEGADLDYLGDVDINDVGEFTYWWLSECPVDWPWK